MSLYGKDRGGMRQVFFNTWQKYKQSQALQGVESLLIDVILLHPEYHSILENRNKYLDFDFPPEQGQGNPFLHMSLHVTINEQLSIDNPPGIRQHFQTLQQKHEKHDALHVLLECLAEAIWKAQRHESADLEKDYLACVTEQTRK
ncbi:hypothetical protein BMS3Abin11_00400 [bacterium BMS3Abin11]|nr:hypothetical protein BMS3Abin11_00400 [bacterium BMS3Abin11]GMT40899.1 MAG: hypothetical protein IEMM0001_1634 [bacterium]